MRLSGEGMSTRAIAPIVGVTQQQVSRDVPRLTHLVSVDKPATVSADLRGAARLTPPMGQARRLRASEVPSWPQKGHVWGRWPERVGIIPHFSLDLA